MSKSGTGRWRFVGKTDEELMALARCEEGGLQELMYRHQDRAIRFARSRLRDRGEADDVVLEAFCRVNQKLREPPPQTDWLSGLLSRLYRKPDRRPVEFWPWLLRFVRYVIISHLSASNIGLIAVLIAVAKFGYGVGSAGQMLYMMQQIAPGPYKLAHYTFATALMGACMAGAGSISGALAGYFGFQSFFALVLLTAIPSILATVCAPFYSKDSGAYPKPAHA